MRRLPYHPRTGLVENAGDVMDLLLSISTASYCTRCGEVCFMHTSIAVPFEYSIHAHTEHTVTSVTCIICTLTRGVRYEWHVYRV